MVDLTGTFDPDTNQLCMRGTSEMVYPGTEININAVVCVDMTAPLAPALASTDFEATVELEPIGLVRISGPYNADNQTLCLTGETDINFPGVPTAMTATACIDFSDPMAPGISSVSFGGSVSLEPIGEIAG